MKNWMKKPVALSARSPFGRIHAGIRIPDTKAETMIARRRPKNWERYPIIVPPTQAPVFMRIDAREAEALSRSFCVNMNVV
jgi:hypothetical protein